MEKVGLFMGKILYLDTDDAGIAENFGKYINHIEETAKKYEAKETEQEAKKLFNPPSRDID